MGENCRIVGLGFNYVVILSKVGFFGDFCKLFVKRGDCFREEVFNIRSFGEFFELIREV